MKRIAPLLLILLATQLIKAQCIPFSQQGKWGICTLQGKVIFAAKADYIYKAKSNFFKIHLDGKEGIANDSGQVIIPIEYEKIELFKNYLALKKNLWALADEYGKLLTDFEYSGIHQMSTEYILLNNPNKQIVYNTQNKTVSPTYQQIFYGNQSTDKYPYFFGLRYRNQDTLGGLYPETLAPSSHCYQCDAAWTVGEFGIAQKNNQLFFFLANKEIPATTTFKSFYSISDKILVAKESDRSLWLVNAYTQSIQQPISPCSKIFAVTDSMMAYESKQEYGLINHQGQITARGFAKFPKLRADGYIEFVKAGKVGILNKHCQELIPPTYDSIGVFLQNHAVAYRNGKAGLISIQNKSLLPFEYHQIKNFDTRAKAYRGNDMLMVNLDDRNRIVDSTLFTNVNTVEVKGINQGNSMGMIHMNRTNAQNVARAPNTSPPLDSIVYKAKNYQLVSSKTPFRVNTKGKSPIPGALDKLRNLYGLSTTPEKNKEEILPATFWDIRLADLYVGTRIRVINQWGKTGILNIETKKVSYTVPGELGGKKGNYDIIYMGPYRQGLARVNIGGVLLLGSDISDLGQPYHGNSHAVRNGKWIYLNQEGKPASNLHFDYASDFHHGQAIVSIKGKYGIIDSLFHWVVSPSYDKLSFLPGSNYKIYLIECNTKETGIIDAEGRIIVQGGYSKIAQPYDGPIAVLKSKWGFVDRNGTTIIAAQYLGACSFSEGLAAVKKSAYWSYINEQGIEVISLPMQKAEAFHQGVAPVLMNNKWHLIRKDGSMVSKTEYDNVKDYYMGVWIASKNKKWGLLAPDGNWAVPPRHDRIKFLAPYAIMASFSGKGWYLYDFENNSLNRTGYTQLKTFQEGLCAVESKKNWGYIDSTGKLIIPAKFQHAGHFSEQRALVRLHNKLGYIDPTGVLQIATQYSEASAFSSGKAIVRLKQGNCFYIDPEGKEIFRTSLTTIPNSVLRGHFYLSYHTIYDAENKALHSSIGSVTSLNSSLFKVVKQEKIKSNSRAASLLHPILICQRDMSVLQEVREIFPYSQGYFRYSSMKQQGALSFDGKIISPPVNGKVEMAENGLIKISNWSNVEWVKPDGRALVEEDTTNTLTDAE